MATADEIAALQPLWRRRSSPEAVATSRGAQHTVGGIDHPDDHGADLVANVDADDLARTGGDT
jgi:hypothetical protein